MMKREVLLALGGVVLVGGALILGGLYLEGLLSEPQRAVHTPKMPDGPVHLDIDESTLTGSRIDAESFLAERERGTGAPSETSKQETSSTPKERTTPAAPLKETGAKEQAQAADPKAEAPEPEPATEPQAQGGEEFAETGMYERRQLDGDVLHALGLLVEDAFPGYTHGLQYEPGIGDQVLLASASKLVGAERAKPHYFAAEIQGFEEGEVVLDVLARLDTKGARHQDSPGCWVSVGDKLVVHPLCVLRVIKIPAKAGADDKQDEPLATPEPAQAESAPPASPAPRALSAAPPTAAPPLKVEPPAMVVPKNRRKRYRVIPGGQIELRPEKMATLPRGSTLRVSRDDVEMRVIEVDGTRAVISLEGVAGEVNVALLVPKGDRERALCSWKFDLAKVA
ncbi:hypothetical protein PPSIR1_25176 [Plesiocystis pacifica SIR-1]|uniref:Uncharacterized protein n=1 Tax=Plesiocystis pacifica SIR-1 TaxID=391625 RepID=A6GDY3_9BACT|nr:hypothetical protein [Plesiocystis pacifica]EDM75932.1 hypothetical protein PPSIR1_25176 [Plesiocystis pacifica SIR-1]